MKRNISLVFLLLLGLVLTSIFLPTKISSVSAEASVIVVGEGYVTVAPNTATINIAVETRKEDNLA